MRNSSLILDDIEFIDITTYVKKHPERKDNLECVWPLDNIHDEVVAVAKMFNGNIEIPICDRHLTWHRAIVTLFYAMKNDSMNDLKLESLLEWMLGLDRDTLMSELISRGLIPIRQ